MVPRRAGTVAPVVFIIVAVIGLALVACADPVAKGRIEGEVRAGGACGSAAGAVCLPRAVAGEVQAQRDGKVEASTRTSPTGRYELMVDAGHYDVVVDAGGGAPVCGPVAVDIRAAGSTTVDIHCGR